MDSDSLQFRGGSENILFVEGKALPINPGIFSLPEGLYRYGIDNRLLVTPDGTQAIGLTPEQTTSLRDTWPELVKLGVDVYAAEWIQSVMGDRNQQVEDLVDLVTKLITDDYATEGADDFYEALKVWIGEIKDLKAAKKSELDGEDALATFDFFADWPLFPPESY